MERVLLFDLDIFPKNYLQDITNGKFPATAQSHGQVGLHALVVRPLSASKYAPNTTECVENSSTLCIRSHKKSPEVHHVA